MLDWTQDQEDFGSLILCPPWELGQFKGKLRQIGGTYVSKNRNQKQTQEAVNSHFWFPFHSSALPFW